MVIVMLFSSLEREKPALQKLVQALRQTYPYASVLAVDDDSRTWRIGKSGKSITTAGLGGGKGYVVRVFDSIGCVEYSFNAFSESEIPAITKAIAKQIADGQAAAISGISPLHTPIPTDEPAVLHRETFYQIHPRICGDERILQTLHTIREQGMQRDARVLDVIVRASYRSFRKLFLSEQRDLDQTAMWMTASVVVLTSRGEEVKEYYRPYSNLGGAELFDQIQQDIPQIVDAALELLDSRPIPPGEYDCICDPATTGMIVHEAFGHGVEMDMFVKDRALAQQFIGKEVASSLVTMHDGSAVSEAATAFFDDEGNLTGDTIVIDHGILRTGMCDALSAARLGVRPTGNGRRESYERKAYTRMTNTYFEGGTSTPEEMIASIKYGFLLENPSSGMEDPKNWGIQCMVTIAREIRDGKLTGTIYSPIVLTGYVPDLLKSVTMMSKTSVLCGSGYCGKGYKEWVKVSDGGPYMKARIRLG